MSTSTLSLDFSDASFDQDDIYRIGGDGFVYEMKDAPTGQPQAIQPAEGGKYLDQNGNPVSNGGTLGSISAMALTLPPGAVFDFEFVDTDGYREDDPSDTDQDQYKITMSDGATGSPVQEFYMAEQFAAGQLTNQSNMAFTTTSVMTPGGTRSIHLDTPATFIDAGTGVTQTASELKIEVIGGDTNSPTYMLKVPSGGTDVEVTFNSARDTFNAQTHAGVTDLRAL